MLLKSQHLKCSRENDYFCQSFLGLWDGMSGHHPWIGSALRSRVEEALWYLCMPCNPQKNQTEMWSAKIFFLDHFGFVSVNCGRTLHFPAGDANRDRMTIVSSKSSGLQTRGGFEITPFLELKLFWQSQSFLRGVWVCMNFFRKCPLSSSSGRQILAIEGWGRYRKKIWCWLPFLWLMGQNSTLMSPAPMSWMLSGSGDPQQQTVCSHQH